MWQSCDLQQVAPLVVVDVEPSNMRRTNHKSLEKLKHKRTSYLCHLLPHLSSPKQNGCRDDASHTTLYSVNGYAREGRAVSDWATISTYNAMQWYIYTYNAMQCYMYNIIQCQVTSVCKWEHADKQTVNFLKVLQQQATELAIGVSSPKL